MLRKDRLCEHHTGVAFPAESAQPTASSGGNLFSTRRVRSEKMPVLCRVFYRHSFTTICKDAWWIGSR